MWGWAGGYAYAEIGMREGILSEAVEYTLTYIWVCGGAVETVEMWGRVGDCDSEIVQIRFRIQGVAVEFVGSLGRI